jgi:hypothetical protein
MPTKEQAIALYEKLHGALPTNVSARQLEEVIAEPEVKLPAMAVSAVLNNKRARYTIATIAVFLPSLWNIFLLITIILFVLAGKPLSKLGFSQTGFREFMLIIFLYFPLAFLLNLGLLRVTGKVAQKI